MTIDGIKFSCPKGFTVQTVSGYVMARLMQHDKGMAGVFVILPGKNINNEFIEGIANAMASTLLKDGVAYKWNRDIAYAKVSKLCPCGAAVTEPGAVIIQAANSTSAARFVKTIDRGGA